MTTARQTECKHDTKLMILNRISGCVKAQELAREAAQQLGGGGEAIQRLNENVYPMIHLTFIISLNHRLSSAEIKIICWLNKDKGEIGSFIFQECHCHPRERTSVFPQLFTMKVI